MFACPVLSTAQGTDITSQLVDRLKLHSALGIETNSVGVPKLLSAVRLLQENPELTADTVDDFAPSALLSETDAEEWRECVAENHRFFAGTALPLAGAVADGDDAVGGDGGAGAGADAPAADAWAADARVLSPDALSADPSTNPSADTEREALSRFVAVGLCSGELPEFSVAVNRNNKMWLVPLSIEVPQADALFGGCDPTIGRLIRLCRSARGRELYPSQEHATYEHSCGANAPRLLFCDAAWTR